MGQNYQRSLKNLQVIDLGQCFQCQHFHIVLNWVHLGLPHNHTLGIHIAKSLYGTIMNQASHLSFADFH